MMQRLFWRIFGVLWIATVVLLVMFAWVGTSNFETEKIPGTEITRLQAALDDLLARTTRELRHDGEEATRQWLRTADGFGPAQVYVFTADGKELLGREVSPNVRAAAAQVLANLRADDPGSSETYSAERLRARATRTRGHDTYAMVAAREGSFFARLMARRPTWFWQNILVAMAASAALSLLLAWYVSSPLQRIRASTHRFAEGDLDARVGRIRFGRSAEVVALATEFDAMAERIKTLVESHRRLVRDVSHELRSPLARQRVALELARDGDSAQVQGSLDRIEREADRLEGMLAQSLELSRLETTSDALVDDIALDALLEDVILNADYEGALRSRKVVLAERAHLQLIGSHAALYSAFENVIRNALAYTADGSTVVVRLLREGDVAHILVRDRGPGVADPELARIFEPFYRTDSARTRGSGGTGLGLAIAARAIKRHRGSIQARNAEGGGLEVTIKLPLKTTR
ncbi:ATP-binding protein [Dokdonella sp.]|uniref:ATP-binding protein n=1 Tax=Dokdonella sp. TaxID=2291710 RepID=UPI0025B9546F|nr:ATP-binding protein [Dokdonella sp.]MBX3688663.1 HAMP domain-containing protein [Dokdonella sp.]